jgi:hypothetical protein
MGAYLVGDEFTVEDDDDDDDVESNGGGLRAKSMLSNDQRFTRLTGSRRGVRGGEPPFPKTIGLPPSPIIG